MNQDLDYTNLTPEQIEQFVYSTTLTVEVDANHTLAPTLEGEIYEGEIASPQATGWLSGQVLGIEINYNFNINAEDLIRYALDCFKEVNGDLKQAQDLLIDRHLDGRTE